jgi:hypothetical protein
VLGWARRFHARPGGAGGRVRSVVGGQAGCSACRCSHAVARSVDHAQPGGIFRIRRRAWVIIRAGAEKTRKRSVLVEALASSPSSARWRSQAVNEVARAASCSQALLRS